MKKYFVQVPFAGHFCIEVVANNEEEAKVLAFNENPFVPDSNAYIEEVEYYEQMNRGNISYCTLSELNIEEIEE